MKIVIDIDEKDYEFIKSVNSIMKNSDTFQRIATDLFRATQAGTSLSKGCGRLIDGDALYKLFEQDNFIWEADSYILTAPTIIEADKVE